MPIATSDLDRWLLSELNMLVRDVTEAYENYDVPGATRPIEGFVEKLSTWYLRRSRRRFWKSESDSDKQAAYSTLYTALVTVAQTARARHAFPGRRAVPEPGPLGG